jgi:hypothetical protein
MLNCLFENNVVPVYLLGVCETLKALSKHLPQYLSLFTARYANLPRVQSLYLSTSWFQYSSFSTSTTAMTITFNLFLFSPYVLSL